MSRLKPDDRTEFVEYDRVALGFHRGQRPPHGKSYDETKKKAKIICSRIALIRPYLEQVADFMFESETKSRLRTEVNVYLYDEAAEERRTAKYWRLRKKNPEEPLDKYLDPLSSFYITMYFADTRDRPIRIKKGSDKRRYLTIELHNEPYTVPIAHVYFDMKRYDVGT